LLWVVLVQIQLRVNEAVSKPVLASAKLVHTVVSAVSLSNAFANSRTTPQKSSVSKK
jgi:hypothetical protein